jgi:hypothetical protein
MIHLWVFQGINDKHHYDYRCCNCGLDVALEYFNDLQDLGKGVVCYREPIQLELF